MRRSCMPLLAILLLAGSIRAFDIHTLLDSDPQTDPNAKPCQLTQAQLDQILTSTTTGATAADSTVTGKYILISDKLSAAFAQSVAQLLSSSGFAVCQTSSAQQLPGDVTVIQPGARQIVYYGKRNAETLYRFVQKLDARYSGASPMFTTITNKMEKKAFEKLTMPKVVAFFPDPTTDPAFVQFQLAARQLAPNPPFYVVHDAHLAQKLKLNQPGQIALIHRVERSIVHFQSEPQVATAPAVTAAEIIAWITQNRGLILHELDDTNVFDPEVMDPSKYLLAAIADQTSPMGLYLHKILTKAIQNISRENEIRANLSAAAVDQTTLPDPNAIQQPVELIKLDDIEIIWIDLQKYPLAAQRLSQTQNGRNKDVHFGLVQVPSGVLTNAQPDQWFDVSLLHPLIEKNAEATNIQILRDWILTVTERMPKPAVDPNAPAADQAEEVQIEVLQQEFTLEPEPVNVRQGGSFVLDCKVQYKAGQCQWVKDDEPIEVGTIGAYQWVNEADISDCSISVSGADATRDTGLWVCEVTDASQTDGTVVVAAIASKPVNVKVRPVKVAKATTKTTKPTKTAKKTAPKGEL